jgi:hypothetical protein
MRLKLSSGPITTFKGRSDILALTNLPVGTDTRKWYLQNADGLLPPFISSSEFVPSTLIEHLMRKKKNSAMGVKFQPSRNPPDAITNMEGAMHTFITPIVLASILGDYVYDGGHRMIDLGSIDIKQQARTVIVSAQIQPDFEGPDVMLALSALNKEPILGTPLSASFSILSVEEKESLNRREAYDILLRRHMVHHLTVSHRLPSINETASQTIDLRQAILFMENITSSPAANFADVVNVHIQLDNGSIISLELLFNSAVHQLRNELSALEVLAPQGYVYTSDPPSIFARETGATILNRLQFLALKKLASSNSFSGMRAFAFNDYDDRNAIALLEKALSTQPHVQVVPKNAFFRGPRRTYQALSGTEGALLVLHNNSDAFGQNIETEWANGSMDGAIGAASSVAGSLRRDRPDLLTCLM